MTCDTAHAVLWEIVLHYVAKGALMEALGAALAGVKGGRGNAAAAFTRDDDTDRTQTTWHIFIIGIVGGWLRHPPIVLLDRTLCDSCFHRRASQHHFRLHRNRNHSKEEPYITTKLR